MIPKLDVWPYVRWIEGQFCFDDIEKNDGSIQIGEYSFKLTERQDDIFLKRGIWDVRPWNGSFTNVKVRYGPTTVLHFIPRRIMTKAGVLLKHPNDVAEFFFPPHNPMLYEEELNRTAS